MRLCVIHTEKCWILEASKSREKLFAASVFVAPAAIVIRCWRQRRQRRNSKEELWLVRLVRMVTLAPIIGRLIPCAALVGTFTTTTATTALLQHRAIQQHSLRAFPWYNTLHTIPSRVMSCPVPYAAATILSFCTFLTRHVALVVRILHVVVYIERYTFSMYQPFYHPISIYIAERRKNS